MNEVKDVPTIGYCAGCGGDNLEPLPPNSFSRKPGYVCTGCGLKHRGAKSTLVYAAVLVLGVVMAIGGVAVFFSPDRPDSGRSPLRLLGIGIAVAGWAGWQFRVPTVAAKKSQ